jgi:hypothetical protein
MYIAKENRIREQESEHHQLKEELRDQQEVLTNTRLTLGNVEREKEVLKKRVELNAKDSVRV